MEKNAKLAPSQTPLRQVAIFLHNADFLRLRVTKPPPDSPTERCCFARPSTKKQAKTPKSLSLFHNTTTYFAFFFIEATTD